MARLHGAHSFAAAAALRTLLLSAALLTAHPAHASPETETLMEQIRILSKRIEQLEAAEKQRHSAARKGSEETVEKEVVDLKDRVADVESQVQVLKQPSKVEEALGGVNVGAALTMVGQRALTGTTTGSSESQLNYRADIEVEVPLDSFGKLAGFGDSKLFAHVRFGQGAGLQQINPTFTATPNTTAFFLEGPDSHDATALLAQAWYQFGLPLTPGKSGAQPRFEGTFGKVDVFGFFDQNEVADDETESFMNNVFVHNPLLDSGFDIGADSYGFAPGLIGSYTGDINSVNRWQASLGLFGAGSGSGFDTSFSKPLVMAQLEYTGRVLRDRPGNYRLYAWTNGSSVPYSNEFDTTQEERRTGWGFSIDQEVARHFSLFGRYGHSTKGQVKFDRALTLGGLLGGTAWGRAEDRIGLAVGWLKTSSEFKDAAPGLDADGDGTPDFGWSPSGSETNVELYYALQINKNLQLTPSYQWIGRPGGNPSASDISIIGLRAKAGF